MPSKPIENVTYDEWRQYAVWKFLPESDERDETWVTPVKKYPVKSLGGRVLVSSLVFANGHKALGLLGNLHFDNPEFTSHFLTLSVVNDHGAIFHLARYFDAGYNSSGPKALAKFLGLSTAEIFPITYHIADSIVQGVGAMSSTILASPKKKLTRDEIIALAVP